MPPKEFDSPEDAYAFFGVGQESGIFPDWEKSLSIDELNAVKTYTGGSFTDINGSLRNGTWNPDGHYGKTAQNIDAALAKSNLTQPITVMRGSTASLLGGYNTVEDIKKYVVGKTVIDRAYVSTSANKHAAFSSKPIIYQINIPSGKGRGMFIAPISMFQGENEFLLPRGTSFKVTGVTEKNGKPLVYLDVV